jgi:uncharacterized protein YbjT (DUF2867 family)
MMASDNTTILVAGATGKQGGAVARHLLKAGKQVLAMTRQPESPAAQRLVQLGAKLVQADMESTNSLAQAMAGAQGVFSVQDFYAPGVGFEGEIRQAQNMLEAARRADIKHFVQSTMAKGLNIEKVAHFHSKYLAEQALRASGLPYTLIGTVWFMDNLLDPKNGGPMTFPVLRGSLKSATFFEMLCVDDIGAAVAATFEKPTQFIGQKINLAGDRLTVLQMQEQYLAVIGKKPPLYSIPNWMMRAMHKHFAQQLRWHNTDGFSFGLNESRVVVPQIRSWRDFLKENRHVIG